MTSWRDEYIQALHDRDERERASYQRVDTELIQACKHFPSFSKKTMLIAHEVTHLLEHTAALEAEKAALPAVAPPPSNDSKKKATSTPPTTNDPQLQLRSDLAEALRSNGQLQTRVKAAETELVKLRARTKIDSKNIEDLERERIALSRKVRDRGEEYKVKGKLLEVRWILGFL
jgi:hypothetical protein